MYNCILVKLFLNCAWLRGPTIENWQINTLILFLILLNIHKKLKHFQLLIKFRIIIIILNRNSRFVPFSVVNESPYRAPGFSDMFHLEEASLVTVLASGMSAGQVDKVVWRVPFLKLMWFKIWNVNIIILWSFSRSGWHAFAEKVRKCINLVRTLRFHWHNIIQILTMLEKLWRFFKKPIEFHVKLLKTHLFGVIIQ